ncbi:hypothetical protein PTKIN_Ptkin15bG0165300 [Pterospermum kingtungense]
MVCEGFSTPIKASSSQGLEVTVSTPPPTPTPSPYNGSPSQLYTTQSLEQRKLNDTCFKCLKQGHWAKDCVSNTPPTKASPPPQNIHQLPVLLCHCGVGCTVNVSQSDKNPGRRYYSRNCNCDNFKANRGRKSFFKWCDSFNAPMCKCGAGACTINTQRDSYGNDFKYYTCRIRMGHGSCGFLQFESPPNWSPRSIAEDKRPLISSPQHGEPSNIMTQEDECPIPSSSNRNIVVRESENCNSVTGKGHCVSHLTSRSDIHSRQIEFWNQISAAGNSPNGLTYEVLQNLALHVHGWVGRLAFCPPRVLADPPRHFFCALFPLFDPTVISECVDISDGGSSSIILHASSNAEANEVSQNALSIDTQPSGVPLRTSSLKRSFAAMQRDETDPISKEDGKTPQKDFLSLLESMELVEHGTMLQAANATFDALASVECGPSEHPMKSIQCTSRAAQMEFTVQDNCSQLVPTVKRSIEKCIDDISGNCIHAEAVAAALAVSSNYLQSVNEVDAHIKDMLHQIKKFKTSLLDIAKDMGQSKIRIQAAHQELTKASKLQQDEEEQLMATTALDEFIDIDRRKRQRIIRDRVDEAE